MKGYMQLPTNQTQSVVVPVSVDYIKDLTNQALSLQEENKELKEQCRWLDNEYTKRKVVLLEDNQNLIANLSTSYGDTAFWKSEYENAVNALNRQLILNKGLKEDMAGITATIIDLASTVEKLRSDAKIDKRTITELTYQVEHITLTKEYQKMYKQLIDMTTERDALKKEVQRLSILAVSSSTVVKDASENKVNLSQSEIDFLKIYLSQSLKDASESITSLKSDAKFFKSKDVAYSNHCYKFSDKLKKKAKVLSGIQHKLKKTVLNRKTQAAHQVNQEGYAGHKQAWIAVCDAIEVYCPGFLSERGTGIECAVKAVHALGATKEQWNKIKDMITLTKEVIK